MTLFKSLELNEVFYSSYTLGNFKWRKIAHNRAIPLFGVGSARFTPTEVIITVDEYNNHHSPRAIKPDDLIVWADSTWCFRYELSQYNHMSNDYSVIKADSKEWLAFISDILAPTETTPRENQ